MSIKRNATNRWPCLTLSTMSFLALPVELQLEIGSHLPRSSRGTLCSVNKVLRQIHQRALYCEDLSAPLFYSATHGNNDSLRLALHFGANVNYAKHSGRTPVFRAAAHGNLSTLKLLVQEGADPNIFDHGNQAPMILACEGGHLETVQYLLDLGADVSATSKYGRTPFGAAANFGHIQIVKLLLEHGANRNGIADHLRLTPFRSACLRNQLELAKVLYRDSTYLTTGDGRPSLVHAVVSDRVHSDVMKWFFEADPQLDVEQKDDQGRTLLILAAYLGMYDIVELLLDHGAEVDGPDEYGFTPLYYAKHFYHHTVAELLIQRGAQDNIVVDHGPLPQPQTV